jgi:P27 family predicted phage terminase small subunit
LAAKKVSDCPEVSDNTAGIGIGYGDLMGGRGSGGRNRKSAATKRAQGNPGGRSLNEFEPPASPGEPPMPKWMTPDMKAVWAELIPILREKQVLDTADSIALATLCSNYVLFAKADAAVQKYGTVISEIEEATGMAVLRMNPAVRVRSDTLRHLKAGWQMFGLDPASRSGISTDKSGAKKNATQSALDSILSAKSGNDVVN